MGSGIGSMQITNIKTDQTFFAATLEWNVVFAMSQTRGPFENEQSAVCLKIGIQIGSSY